MKRLRAALMELALVIEEVDARYGERAAALAGATILSCDAAPAARLFTDHVLAWRGRPDIAADWILWAPLLLVDYGPPSPRAPAQCLLRRLVAVRERDRGGGLRYAWADAARQWLNDGTYTEWRASKDNLEGCIVLPDALLA